MPSSAPPPKTSHGQLLGALAGGADDGDVFVLVTKASGFLLGSKGWRLAAADGTPVNERASWRRCWQHPPGISARDRHPELSSLTRRNARVPLHANRRNSVSWSDHHRQAVPADVNDEY
ncbi:hypothetical protein [Streptomyces sp. NPDC015125]|uniref:hypothetical protein n=1 Tax=Streptomyces sp. NPDC015125 TaxID=3364938 RepID=UPI0036F9D377